MVNEKRAECKNNMTGKFESAVNLKNLLQLFGALFL